MPTTTVPGTGIVTMSAIKSAFPNVVTSNFLTNYRGKHQSLPLPGAPIWYSSFRNLTGISPAHTLTAVSGTNVTASSAGSFAGTVGASTTGTLTYTLSSMLVQTNIALHGGSVAYAVTSGSLPTGVSMPANGTIAISTTTPTAGAVAVTVTATNAWGNTATVSLTFNLSSPAPFASWSAGLTAKTYARDAQVFFDSATVATSGAVVWTLGAGASNNHITCSTAGNYNFSKTNGIIYLYVGADGTVGNIPLTWTIAAGQYVQFVTYPSGGTYNNSTRVTITPA